MREVHVESITREVRRLFIEANYQLAPDVRESLVRSLETEVSVLGRDVLKQLLHNASIASEGVYPICQDTGLAVCFCTIGQEVHIIGGSLAEAIDEGVRLAYRDGFLRKSVVRHPLKRDNTGDNTPAIIHYDVVPGDILRLTVAPKGAGSENMSAVKMLKPSDGVEGVKAFVTDVVCTAGPNPCPPIVVGVGVGGNLEKACLLAKSALVRSVGSFSPDALVAQLEHELLDEINRLGIGPQGFGGTVTALAVHIECYPTHIASLPVAVNLNCHVSRHLSASL